MSTLFVFRNSTIMAIAQMGAEGQASVTGSSPRTVELVRGLLQNDFSEDLGFPALHITAARGTVAAWRAVVVYLTTNMGFDVVVQECQVSSVTGLPRVREAESMATATSFVLAGFVPQLIRRAVAVFDSLNRRRFEAAIKFGSFKEYRRQAALTDPRRRRPLMVSNPAPVQARLTRRVAGLTRPAEGAATFGPSAGSIAAIQAQSAEVRLAA